MNFFQLLSLPKTVSKKNLLKSIGMQPANWLFSADVFIKKIPCCSVSVQ